MPTVDESTGIQYLNNDVSRTRMKVSLSDVPSSPSFRAQQLAAMSEAFKSAPPEYQKIMMPHLFALMDVPNKQDIIKAIKEMGDGSPTPEQIKQQIDDAVQAALSKAQYDLKTRELDQKQPLIDARVKKTEAESVNKNVEAQFGAIRRRRPLQRFRRRRRWPTCCCSRTALLIPMAERSCRRPLHLLSAPCRRSRAAGGS